MPFSRVIAFFTGKKAAASQKHAATAPRLPALSEDAEREIRRKMTFEQRCDYMGAMIIEGLQRGPDMPAEEMKERERQWQAKRAGFLSAHQALQQAPANPPAWALKILEQFQKDLRGE